VIRAAQPGGSSFLYLSSYVIGRTDKDSSKVDVRQYYDNAFAFEGIATASHLVLGLIIVIVIVLLLSRSGWRLGWR